MYALLITISLFVGHQETVLVSTHKTAKSCEVFAREVTKEVEDSIVYFPEVEYVDIACRKMSDEFYKKYF